MRKEDTGRFGGERVSVEKSPEKRKSWDSEAEKGGEFGMGLAQGRWGSRNGRCRNRGFEMKKFRILKDLIENLEGYDTMTN